MKKSISILIVLLITHCMVKAQEINKIIFDENAEQDILIGYCDRSGIENDIFSHWYQSEYDEYSVNNDVLEQLNPEIISELKITIVLGTWCHDSQREIPRFFKIIEQLEMDDDQLLIICVNRNKKVDDIPLEELGIELVPTFIFTFNEKELGRIVESAEFSLEQDMQNILSNI